MVLPGSPVPAGPARKGRKTPFRSFFWVALLGSLALAGIGVHDLLVERRASRWPTAPCEITDSKVIPESRGRSSGFVPFVRYQYTVQGRRYLSSRLHRTQETLHSDFADAQRAIARYPVGGRSACHVNPADPADAFLESKPDFVILVISWFPLLIWAIYERVAIADWWQERGRRKRAGRTEAVTANLSLKRVNSKQLLIGICCLAMSLIFATMLAGWPWLQTIRSKSWRAVPCTVRQVEVASETYHQGGRSFRPVVRYAYDFEGSHYESTRLDFSADMHFSYSETADAVGHFSPGQQTTCYVDPANPSRAVLRRSFRPDPFFGLFALGLAGLSVFLIVQRRPDRNEAASPCPWETAQGRKLAEAGKATLKQELPQREMFALAALGAAACVSLAAWLVSGAIRSLLRGEVDVLPLLYGLGAAGGAVACAAVARRFWRGARNPPPRLILEPGVVTLGKPFTVEWEAARDRRGLQFRLWLEGREEAAILQLLGTMHGASREEKVQKWTFHETPLTPGDRLEESAFGQARSVVPADAMHSFEGAKFKIRWRIRADVWDGSRMLRHEHRIIVKPGPVSTP
jgi:hypothetical protein